MNEKKLQLTEDGSYTIAIPAMHVTYHSKHGAIQESMHIFIRSGLDYCMNENRHLHYSTVNIFEVGFGTGLNALLSLSEAIKRNQKINYQTIELYPLLPEEAAQLNYSFLVDEDLQQNFMAMHNCEWNKVIQIHPLFSFQKTKIDIQQFHSQQQFHAIYFDAFDPNTQPELWRESIFIKMYNMLYENGILVTYCSKGIVQRAMKTTGFTIEKLHGPVGKREIVRAIKKST